MGLYKVGRKNPASLHVLKNETKTCKEVGTLWYDLREIVTF
ncbi:hypothetical protein CULT_2420006 [[Clostridium] ultunense Esp]|nr:hypothetical protein CULT_2420006 [[Clostridium] ultunense Esp]